MANRRFWETEKMFKTRCDREAAILTIGEKKLWRIDAIEMKRTGQAWTMGKMDHFTVEAHCKEMAIGVFKLRNKNMDWFVIGIDEEKVVD